MTPLAKQKGANPPSKQEAIAKMIYLDIRNKSMECFTWEELVEIDSYITSRCRRLAQKILNYLEGK